MTIREVLKEFAKKFPYNIDNSYEFLNKTNRMYFDYLDGVFAFYYTDYQSAVLEGGAFKGSGDIYTAHGGNNGNMLGEEDYKYIFNTLVLGNEDFKSWLEKHNMTDADLMALNLEWFNDENTPVTDVEVYCKFDFYAKSNGEDEILYKKD